MTSGKSIFFAAGMISVLLLVFAYYAYPVPAGDSLYFVVPAVQFKEKGELTSPLYPSEWMMDKIIDPSGAKQFLFYPPLFPLVTSALSPEATPRGALIAIAFINIAVVWLSALLLYKVANKRGKHSWQKTLIMLLVLVALASSLAENGRPEVLARLWLVMGCLVPLYVPKKYAYIFYGILLGLMFATHPPAGIFSLLALGIAFGATYTFKDVILQGSKILSIGFVTALGGIALGPFSIRETVEGTFRHAVTVSHIVAGETQKWLTPSNFFHNYIVSPTAPWYGLVALLILISGIFFYRKYRVRMVSPLISLVSAVALAYAMGKITYTIGHNFYLTLFAPLIFLVFAKLFLEGNIAWKGLTVFVCVLVTTGFIRTTLLFPFFLQQGATLEEARADFAELARPLEGKDGLIGVTGGLWTLSEDYEKVYAYNTWPERPKEKTALVFFQQRYSGIRTPPAIEGCARTYDSFSRDLPRIFGVKLGNTMPGYGYAVYDCFNHVKT